MRKLLACVIAGVLVVLTSASAQAAAITFGGQGQSGTDPWGHGWQWLNRGVGDNSVWGIPGAGEGNELFQGPDWVSDFHITFFDLPSGVTIDEDGGATSDLTFAVFDGFDFLEWTPTVDGDTVWFIAPDAAAILDPGEQFFVNVGLTGQLSSFDDISFEAEWTMDFGAVPEPAGLALMGAGLVGLGLARRRRT